MAGFATAICNLTEAELSSNGTVSRRRQETKRAAEILGVNQVINLGIPDRGITDAYLGNVIEVIRELKPKVVLAPYHTDRHPDHVACHHLVKKAVFDAKIHKKQRELGNSHAVEHVYYYFINTLGKEDFIVDVSEVYAKKVAALGAYASQFYRKTGEVDTPLNKGDFLRMIEGRDTLWGYQIGVCFGEALASPEPIQQKWLLS